MRARSNFFSPKNKQQLTTQRSINPEFTTAIRAAKLIRACAALMKPDRSRFHRLTKFILHHIIHADHGHKAGERKILIQNLNVLNGYEFAPDHPLSTYISADVILAIGNKITLSIITPQLQWPAHMSYCKVMLFAVAIDFQLFTTATTSGSSPWIPLSAGTVAPVYIEINNDKPLFISVGVAFTNNITADITCEAIKIIAVNI